MRRDLFKLGAQIRKARKERGLTLKNVADAIGVSESTVSLWERARHQAGAAELRRLAQLLGANDNIWLILAGHVDDTGEWVPRTAESPDAVAQVRSGLLAGPWPQELRGPLLLLLDATRARYTAAESRVALDLAVARLGEERVATSGGSWTSDEVLAMMTGVLGDLFEEELAKIRA